MCVTLFILTLNRISLSVKCSYAECKVFNGILTVTFFIDILTVTFFIALLTVKFFYCYSERQILMIVLSVDFFVILSVFIFLYLCCHFSLLF